VCWLVCPHTWWNVCSRCLMLWRVWSTDSGNSTMSLKHWCCCIGCASQSVSISHWQSWFTKFYTATPQTTSNRSLGCSTFRVDHHCFLHHLIIYSSRQFVAQLSVQGRFRCLGQLFGTDCRMTLRLLTVSQTFVVISKMICSCTCIQGPFNNCISFSILA